MQKWWTSKTDSYKAFIKRLLLTWGFTLLLMLVGPISGSVTVTDICFTALASFASYQFFKDWKVNEENAELVRQMHLARQSICDTCPWVFMAMNGIKPPSDVAEERYKRGELRGAAQQQPLPAQTVSLSRSRSNARPSKVSSHSCP